MASQTSRCALGLTKSEAHPGLRLRLDRPPLPSRSRRPGSPRLVLRWLPFLPPLTRTFPLGSCLALAAWACLREARTWPPAPSRASQQGGCTLDGSRFRGAWPGNDIRPLCCFPFAGSEPPGAAHTWRQCQEVAGGWGSGSRRGRLHPLDTETPLRLTPPGQRTFLAGPSLTSRPFSWEQKATMPPVPSLQGVTACLRCLCERWPGHSQRGRGVTPTPARWG